MVNYVRGQTIQYEMASIKASINKFIIILKIFIKFKDFYQFEIKQKKIFF